MPSFDVVCRVDLQEVDNAVNQTLRELAQRFDFRGANSEVRREENAIHLHSADDFKVRALGDILREKLARRQVPLKALQIGPIEPGPAGTAKQKLDLQQGIPIEKAREIVKLVKEMKTKVQVAIQGDQVRVTGKKKDDLQAAVQLLRAQDLGIAMQFVNFRD
ncbi:MAG: YajQ family cyclic di-GMP-binding protein [Deltaproteobacteria bacterium]|nr:MAG: YajQ family cyclic di-GMP-binding protein [Deltaproteobacteria bacterium]TMA60963.1 MAG: YajQ family cyclic di-GMP-binding protein [Deltaproteobacteria bacterium]